MDAELFSKCIERVEEDVKSALADADPAPYISIGGAKTQKPFEVVVREIVTEVSVEDVGTNAYMGGRSRGGYSIEFSIAIEMWAKSASLTNTTSIVQEWAARIMSAISADKTLGGLVDHAQPYISNVGTAPANNLYMAAIEGGVRVKAAIDPIIESGE